MSGIVAPVFDAAHRAALSGGKHLVYVCPPAPWAAAALFAQLAEPARGGASVLVLAPSAAVAELATVLAAVPSLRSVHPVTGLARTGRLSQAGAVRTLVATPRDALQLFARSALASAELATVAIAWPEILFELQERDALDTVLAEAAGARRLVLTGDDTSVAEFLERHARRAPVAVQARPGDPVGPIRFAIVAGDRVPWAVRATLDGLNPESTVLWDPSPRAPSHWQDYDGDPTVRVVADPAGAEAALAIATVLPSSAALTALRTVARDVIALVQPYQLGYLQRIAQPASATRLPSEADRARDDAFRLREAIRARLTDDDLPAGLLALAPLFDEFDPALVAAALSGLRPDAAATAAATAAPAWVRLHLNVGRRDRVRTADVVGALLHGLGMPKDQVGRVEVRESFSLVEVRAEVAERALRGLDGVQLRGRTVAARFDHR